MAMTTSELVQHVRALFSRAYLGGIPSSLNDNAAFLSFVCCLTAIEALGGFVRPSAGNGARFKGFVRDFFPPEYQSHSSALWKLRNAAVHGFSPGPYGLTHHNGHLHMTSHNGTTVLNAEDFYAALVVASERYFTKLASDVVLQKAFAKRAADPETGIMVVGPMGGNP
jgi:hypothetical protein